MSIQQLNILISKILCNLTKQDTTFRKTLTQKREACFLSQVSYFYFIYFTYLNK